jgi:endonuclease/exonuclease/phosphatase (EEP) superfamily protein YafD
MTRMPDAGRITRPLAFVTALVGLSSLLAFGGRWSWACELLVNFRTHFALLLGLCLIVAVATRHWRLAGIAGLGLALNLWPMQHVYAARAPSPPGATPVRVIAFNVHVTNRDVEGVARHLSSLSPDAVVLEEVTPASANRLVELLPQFPHRYAVIHEGVRGVLLLSRWPLADAQPVVHRGRPYGLRADLQIGDRTLRLFGLHLDWPLFPGPARVRNGQLVALAGELARCSGHCIVVGDFNTTPWSSHLRALIANSRFSDCASGRGFLPTWPSFLPALLRIRIDHCLASPAVSIADVQVGAAAGSDHFVTINDLLIPAPPPASAIGR